ncbi:MAG: hypothetical protein KKB90_00025 [Actinobacteria bacterium]|nr:hypothetical protein [Actinomycetota bacterium]MCG2818093.1 hypothetical protein [Actinomycetes bacterium]MBU4217335.1 hypothetical protein [Actinomycetota bacterium]MBU4359264.1 hypothetical protein [Actinomycetota bacterium]MBU4393215.1 hypothetical protein [Actinomycetota bacterium]
MDNDDLELLRTVLSRAESGELSPQEAARKAAAIDPESTVTSLLDTINSLGPQR